MLLEIAWAVAALLFFLLFSVTPANQERPLWYSIGTSVFEVVAYLVAALLCFRNWRSPQIVSGRNVWLCIGLGMFFYFIGNLLFSYWEIGLKLEPDVSPGDIFYVPTYLCLIVGLLLAVSSRRLNLEVWQWGIVAAIVAASIGIAYWASTPDATAQSLLMEPAMAQTAPAQTKPSPTRSPAAKPPVKAAPAAQKPASPSPAAPAPVAKPTPAPVASPAPTEAAVDSAEANAPEWAKAIGEILKPFKPVLDWFYVIADVLLLIIATTLLLAFWGGRFAQSWRMIAAAALCLYIADIAFKVASRDPNYQSGGLLEVGWVFSGVLFGIGAALEYDVSSRSRSRAGGRRRAA